MDDILQKNSHTFFRGPTSLPKFYSGVAPTEYGKNNYFFVQWASPGVGTERLREADFVVKISQRAYQWQSYR